MLGCFLVGGHNTAGIPVNEVLFCLVGTGGTVFARYNIAGTSRLPLG